MSNVLEIFNPYLPFFVSFISIGLSLFLAIKGVNIWAILLANLIVSVIIFPALGLENYNLITILLTEVIDILEAVFERLLEVMISPIQKMLENIFNIRINVFGGGD